MNLEDRDTYTRMNEKGFLEIIDCFTGKVLAIQGGYRDIPPASEIEKSFSKVRLGDSDVLVPNGLEGELKEMESPRRGHYYSPLLAKAFCARIAEGATLKEVCAEPGMPTIHQVQQWRMHSDEFENLYEKARQARAELLHDEVLETSREPMLKDDVPAAKLKTDNLKWSAEKSDPNRFGNRREEKESAPTTIVIETGIRRKGDEERSSLVVEPDYRDMGNVNERSEKN